MTVSSRANRDRRQPLQSSHCVADARFRLVAVLHRTASSGSLSTLSGRSTRRIDYRKAIIAGFASRSLHSSVSPRANPQGGLIPRDLRRQQLATTRERMRTVLRDRFVAFAISRAGFFSRKRIRETLPIMAMEVAPHTRASSSVQ